ncbi:MAG TPA: tetratricopeptide repeat protein [Mesorhizobium sp.]
MSGSTAGLLAAACVVLTAFAAKAETITRAGQVAGSVIQRKSGEEIRFVDVSDWRFVDLSQDVVAGDYLRTNAMGTLAVLFADQTQMRLGRNTTLLVKRAAASVDAEFQLEAGTIWARAARGGLGLTVETPAAAAAIRGTDWTMRVEAGGKTTLTVLEGSVDLYNAQGSVTVNAGEGAVASIGQAPTKLFNINPDDREQMLYYLAVRDAFVVIPASPLPVREMVETRRRLEAKPAAARSAEDWLLLAESRFSLTGMRDAAAALSEARSRPLTRAQQARVQLIEAMMAGAEANYAEAARLYEEALPALDARRRAIALYGGYFARSLADPNRVEQPPKIRGGGPYAAVAEAFAAGFLQDIPAAIDVLKRAERMYPDDATLPAMRSQLALLIDDRKQVVEAFDRALALDPDDPTALHSRALYRSQLLSDLEGARDDLKRSIETAPGSGVSWNTLGLVEDGRGASREAEEAFKTAIALDPRDPVSNANLAILYLEQGRVREAKKLIDVALASDPSISQVLVARSRYYLEVGDFARAREDALAASAADPANTSGLLLQAAINAQQGDIEQADQALDNANRLDPNDSVTTNFRTVLAISEYEADEAITYAQESLRRARERGGDFTSISANQRAGTALADAYRLSELNAWGRYYGDLAFDPFEAGSYFDQAIAGGNSLPITGLTFDENSSSGNTSSFSSSIQGLLIDSQSLTASSIYPTFIRTPFLELTAGGGVVTEDSRVGNVGSVSLQAYSPTPVPWSVLGDISGTDFDFSRLSEAGDASLDLDTRNITGYGYLTSQPSPYDNLVAFFSTTDRRDRLGRQIFINELPQLAQTLSFEDQNSYGGGVGWSHLFSYRNMASAAFFFTDASNSEDYAEQVLGADSYIEGGTIDTEARTYVGAVNHLVGIGDVTLRYGMEAGVLNIANDIAIGVIRPNAPPLSQQVAGEADITLARPYLSALYEVNNDLHIDAGIQGTFLNGGTLDVARPDPHVGVSWAPVEGHFLRAAYQRTAPIFSAATLAPIGTVGLLPNEVPVSINGYTDTLGARWDAQWTSWLFTSIDYQHQESHDLSIFDPFLDDEVALSQGRIDRVNLAANVWVGHGFGLFGNVALAETRNLDPASRGYGERLPFVPDAIGSIGISYVNPINLKVTLAGNFVGEREGSLPLRPLDPYWTLDATAIWEPFGKRVVVEGAARNLLDERFNIAPFVPGDRRSFYGALKVRF